MRALVTFVACVALLTAVPTTCGLAPTAKRELECALNSLAFEYGAANGLVVNTLALHDGTNGTGSTARVVACWGR